MLPFPAGETQTTGHHHRTEPASSAGLSVVPANLLRGLASLSSPACPHMPHSTPPFPYSPQVRSLLLDPRFLCLLLFSPPLPSLPLSLSNTHVSNTLISCLAERQGSTVSPPLYPFYTNLIWTSFPSTSSLSFHQFRSQIRGHPPSYPMTTSARGT